MVDESLLQGKKILIVDDEPDVLDTLEDLLDMCEIIKASSYKDAQNLLESHKFDMAIFDIMGVNGFELLKIANDKKVTAIMLTAHALSPENTEKAYSMGAASYVPKEQMIEIVTYLIDVLQAQEERKNPWRNWLDRFGSLYDKKFGTSWREKQKGIAKIKQ